MYFRREKGWSGSTYYVQMTAAEIEARRKLGLVIGVPVVTFAMVFLMALAAGLIK